MADCKPCEFADKLLSKFSKQEKCLIYLLATNLFFLILYQFDLSFLSFLTQILLYFTLFSIVKNGILKSEQENCSCLKEENISKAYFNFDDKFNSSIDFIRKAMLIEDFTLTLKVIFSLTFINSLGKSFGSCVALLIFFDVYFVVDFLLKNEKLTEIRRKVFDFINKKVLEKIPKYKEKK